MKQLKFLMIICSTIILSCLITSCKKDSNVSTTGEKLNIIAPSGQQISSSVDQLKLETSLTVEKKAGKKTD